MIRNLLALTGIVAVALVAAMAIHAYGWLEDDGLPPPRIAVSYAGLDLTEPAGMRILEQRINAAINDVCPREDNGPLYQRNHVRECRRDAIAAVRPQVERAVAAAEARRFSPPSRPAAPFAGRHVDDRDIDDRDVDDSAAADRMLPPYVAPARTPAPAAAAASGRRLVRRTVTTTVTTTTGAAGPKSRSAGVAAERVVATPRPRPGAARLALAKPAGHSRRRSTAYERGPAIPGSWLPPAAWRAIDRANVRALATGTLTRWSSPGRSGYVTPSAARRIDGATCRNLRVVKFADRRQIVVASGTLCRDRHGRVAPRDCP